MPKMLRTFILKLFRKEDVKQFEMFQMLAIFNGLKPSDAVNLVVAKYNHRRLDERKRQELQPLQLVGEVELIEILKKKGISVTKVTMKKWRDNGILVGPNNQQIWGTDGYSIVYDLKPTLEFVKRRKQQLASRLSNGGANVESRTTTD